MCYTLYLPAAIIPVFVAPALAAVALLPQGRQVLLLLPTITGMLVLRREVAGAMAPLALLLLPVRAAVVIREAMLAPVDFLRLGWPVLPVLPLPLRAALFIIAPLPVVHKRLGLLPTVSEGLLLVPGALIAVLWPVVPFVVSFFFLVMHLVQV